MPTKTHTGLLLALLFPSLIISSAAQSGKDTPTIAREASPSVVRVVLRDEAGMELGSGSGFVINSDGRVVTNYHVIHIPKTAQADIRFPDGASYQVGGVIAIDQDRDLAVLKVKVTGRQFPFLRLGNSDAVKIGEHVVAIGSPLAGLSTINTEATISDGIVSGKREWSNGKMSVLQITAPISPGSSGGALLNSEGDVIGVTFAGLVGGQNLNFAIPIGYVRSLTIDGTTKSLATINTVLPDDQPKLATATGSYTGIWQSGKFSVSGAATMTIKVSDEIATAEIFLTGGEVTSASLRGPAHRTGENIWTVELSSDHPKLSVRGILRDNSFVGDYSYSRSQMRDQGQWLLKR